MPMAPFSDKRKSAPPNEGHGAPTCLLYPKGAYGTTGGMAYSHWRRRFMPALVALFLLLLMPWPAGAAEAYKVAFRTLGEMAGDPPLRLDINVWYPGIRAPRQLSYSPWTFPAARNSQPAEGRFPLILLSHATPGTRFSYHNAASRLAARGFVVAAPTHARDSMHNMDDLFTWPQLENRVRELSAGIDVLLADKDLSACIDPGRIGVLGFGTGGTAALLLGGALPDCAPWPGYCARAGALDAYCDPWVRGKIDALCANFPLKSSLADQRIKAIASVAPGYGLLFGPTSFRHFYPPLLLAIAGAEKVDKAELHARAIARLPGVKATVLELPDADAGALMAPCPPSIAAELPELCLSVSEEARAALARRLDDALTDFFLNHLGSASHVPQIPAPPKFTAPAPAPETPPPAALEKPKKRNPRQSRNPS